MNLDLTPMGDIDDPIVREIFSALPELAADVARLQRGELIERSAGAHMAAAERAARNAAVSALHAWLRMRGAMRAVAREAGG